MPVHTAKDNHQTIKDLMTQICKKVIAKIAKMAKDNVNLQVDLQADVYPYKSSQIYQNYQAGKISKEELQISLLSSFLDNPLLFEGKLLVTANGTTVIDVENEKVICDDLGVVAEMWAEKIKTDYREEAGKDLLNYVHTVLAMFGKRQPDGWMSFTRQNYIYSEREGQIRVITQKDKQEILNNDGFTEAATTQDIADLLKLGKRIEQFKHDYPHNLSPRFKL